MEITRNSFTSRVVDLWNNLPDDVVSSIDLNTFKGRLDKEMRDVRAVVLKLFKATDRHHLKVVTCFSRNTNFHNGKGRIATLLACINYRAFMNFCC